MLLFVILIHSNVKLTNAEENVTQDPTYNRYCNFRHCLPNETHVFCAFPDRRWKGYCADENNRLVMNDEARHEIVEVINGARLEAIKGKHIFKDNKSPGKCYGMPKIFYSMTLEAVVEHYAKQCLEHVTHEYNYCSATDEFPYVRMYDQAFHPASYKLPFGPNYVRQQMLFMSHYHKTGHKSSKYFPAFKVRRPGFFNFALYYKSSAVGCYYYKFIETSRKKRTRFVVLCLFGFYTRPDYYDNIYQFKKPANGTKRCGCAQGFWETAECFCVRGHYDGYTITSTTSTVAPVYHDNATDRILRDMDFKHIDLPIPNMRTGIEKKSEPKYYLPVFHKNAPEIVEEQGEYRLQFFEIEPEGLIKPTGHSKSHQERHHKHSERRTQHHNPRAVDVDRTIFDTKYGEDYSDFQQVVLP